MHRFTRLAVAAAWLLAPSLAAASSWQIDSAHSSAQFAVSHLMVSTVRGTLGKVTGNVTLDESDITKSSVSATIDATGIDTREAKRDEHLRSPDFLDTKQFPTITFTSTKVEKLDERRFQVTGDLTLRGVTKPVVLTVEGSPTPMQDPFGNTKLGGVVKTKLNRQDFGIAWNKKLDAGGLVVGDEVDVTIDVELNKAP